MGIFIFGAALIFISIPPLIAGAQIVAPPPPNPIPPPYSYPGYNYRRNSYISGQNLAHFNTFGDAIAYCNSHSNCDGVHDVSYCKGYDFMAKEGSRVPSEHGSCSWVMLLYS